MTVVNEEVTTKFDHMTNKELGAYVRGKLKENGITRSQVSVRVKDCGYSTSVDVSIKDLSVDFELVNKIASEVEYIRYDGYAQEILGGCNTFVHVEYDWQIMRDAINSVTDEVVKFMEDYKDGKNKTLFVTPNGDKYVLMHNHHGREDNSWITYHIALFKKGEKFGDTVSQFNSWDALIGYMARKRAIEVAKENAEKSA